MPVTPRRTSARLRNKQNPATPVSICRSRLYESSYYLFASLSVVHLQLERGTSAQLLSTVGLLIFDCLCLVSRQHFHLVFGSSTNADHPTPSPVPLSRMPPISSHLSLSEMRPLRLSEASMPWLPPRLQAAERFRVHSPATTHC